MDKSEASRRFRDSDDDESRDISPKKTKISHEALGSNKKRKLAHDAYTVGWICVLRSELNASRALLDEEHEPLLPAEKDDNSYL